MGLPKFKDIIGLYADDENDVNTPLEADLQRFTPQEVSRFCAELDLGMEVVPKTTAAIAVAIIRQLQVELAEAGRFCNEQIQADRN